MHHQGQVTTEVGGDHFRSTGVKFWATVTHTQAHTRRQAHTHRHRDTYTYRRTDRHTHEQIDRQIDRETHRQNDRQIYSPMDTLTDREDCLKQKIAER